jgi:hypothetical protein
VVYNHYPILRRVHVELDRIGAGLDGLLECRNRVLGLRFVRTTMGDLFGRPAPTLRQELLGVLVLGTMSAKHRGGRLAGQSALEALTGAGSERLPDEGP